MGMTGNYIAVDDSLLKQIMDGEKDILALDQTQTLDIDKSWQAIHYLLCKCAENGEPPMGYVVPLMDDHEIDCDLDYGAAYITPQQVKQASEYLNSLDSHTVKNMYDFQSMQKEDIYPLIDSDDEQEFYEYIYSNLEELKTYFQKTAAQGYAIIFYII